jgi:DNA (cytosine-5)-methyltransferase 1
MATINFYLDKPDKKGLCPIHLRINCKGEQIKVATCEKVKREQFDTTHQLLKGKSKKAISINHYLNYLKSRTEEMLSQDGKKTYTNKEIKQK